LKKTRKCSAALIAAWANTPKAAIKVLDNYSINPKLNPKFSKIMKKEMQ
jgi:hypothetical protein